MASEGHSEVRIFVNNPTIAERYSHKCTAGHTCIKHVSCGEVPPFGSISVLRSAAVLLPGAQSRVLNISLCEVREGEM